MKPRRRVGSVLILAALAATSTNGCRTTPGEGPAASDGAEPTAIITGLLILETLAPSGSIEAADLRPLATDLWAYQAVSPDDATAPPRGRLEVTTAVTSRFDATLALLSGEERTEFWREEDDGSLRVPAVIEHAKAALTRFDPPLLIAPAALGAGETSASEAAMRVVDARRPSRQREAGRAVQSMTYVDDQRIRIPSGAHRAKRAVIRFSARLRLARVERETVLWIVPGRGIVARDDQQKVTVLGLPAERTSRRLVRRPVVVDHP